MSTEHNKAVVRRYLEEIINRGRFDIADEIFAQDYVNHSAGAGFGQALADFLSGIVDMKAAFPDWHVTIEELMAETDLVVDRVRISATHSGSVNGIAASGRRIETLAMHMWRVVDSTLPHVVSAVVPMATTVG
jgi:predicted ester cyclase